MTRKRVAFAPSKTPLPAPAVTLGQAAEGAWIECDDDALVLGIGRLELLWLSRAAYDHAMRRLPGDEIATVIARRRTAFSARLPSRAKAELYALRLRVLAIAAAERDGDGFGRSLTVLTQLAGGSRFKGIGDVGMLERLLEREQAVRAELDSIEGRPEVCADEIEGRTRLAEGTAHLLAKLGRPEYVLAPLHVSLVRGYLLKPAPPQLLADWKRDGISAVPWRGGVIGPLDPNEATELRPSLQEAKLLLPDGNLAAGLRLSLTPAQLTVELEDRERDLGMAAHVAGLRVDLATFRRNAAGASKDVTIATALADQTSTETPLLMAALARRTVFFAGRPPPLAEAEADFAAAATTMSKLVARQGLEWLPLATELLALGKDI